MRRTFALVIVFILSVAMLSETIWARGGPGGGRPGGGGGGRSAPSPSGGARSAPSHSGGARSAPSRSGGNAARSGPSAASKTPSMSRAQGSSRDISRPSTGNRPQTGDRQVGGKDRPGASNRPELGDKRPDRGTPGGSNRPERGPGSNDSKRPSQSDRPGVSQGRPERPSSNPSRNDLNEFLDLPKTSDNKLAGGNNRFGDNNKIGGGDNRIGDNTKIGGGDNRSGDNTKIGGGDNRIGDNTKIGGDRTNVDVNINTGNKLEINRQNNFNSIRNKYTNVNNRPFDRDHWRNRPDIDHAHWHYHQHRDRYDNNWFWKTAGWSAVGSFVGTTIANAAQPISYDYGSTVVYENDVVYVQGEQVGTSEEYYEQAEQIVDSTPQNLDDEEIEWMPLGVFAIAEEQNASDSGMLLQLAVSKEGVLAGTFYNETTETSRPVEGMVDGETQRAVWGFSDGKNEEVYMETGLYNLTQDNSTALLHFGPEQTQTWLLVRLPEKE